MVQKQKASQLLFFHLMLSQGIYFGPSAFEAGFVSAAHTSVDIKQTIDAANVAFDQLG